MPQRRLIARLAAIGTIVTANAAAVPVSRFVYGTYMSVPDDVYEVAVDSDGDSYFASGDTTTKQTCLSQ
jgi:hypothetical protein